MFQSQTAIVTGGGRGLGRGIVEALAAKKMGEEQCQYSSKARLRLLPDQVSGIGRASAFVFAREKAKLVLAARRVNEGENVAKEIHAGGGAALFVPEFIEVTLK